MAGDYDEVQAETELMAKRALDIIRASSRIQTVFQQLRAGNYAVAPKPWLGEEADGPRPKLVKALPWPAMPTWVVGIRYADKAVRDGSGYAAYTIEEAIEIYEELSRILGRTKSGPVNRGLETVPGDDTVGKEKPGE